MTITQKKLLMLFSNLSLHIVGYLLLNSFLAKRGIHYDVAIPLDYHIPFIKYFAPFYSVVYFVPVATFIICWKNYEIIKGSFKAFFSTGLICLAFFFLIPVEFTLRPTLVPPYDFFENIVRFFYWIDNPPYNCFPSLHVALAIISARVIYLYRPRWAPFFYGLACMIGLSTLFIRQHYIIDLGAGIALALVMSALFLPRSLGVELRRLRPLPSSLG